MVRTAHMAFLATAALALATAGVIATGPPASADEGCYGASNAVTAEASGQLAYIPIYLAPDPYDGDIKPVGGDVYALHPALDIGGGSANIARVSFSTAARRLSASSFDAGSLRDAWKGRRGGSGGAAFLKNTGHWPTI